MRKLGLIGCFMVCFVACDDLTEVENISDRTVTVLAPTDHAVLDTLATTFTWEAMENAENYHVQVAQSTFENALQIVRDTVLVKTNYTTTFSAGNYQWRIRAENSGYRTNYIIQNFIITN